MAVTYYQENRFYFLNRINDWHETCAWTYQYGFIYIPDQENGKLNKKFIPFMGAPAPADIAEAAYGERVDDKLKQATVARILPCIIEGRLFRAT